MLGSLTDACSRLVLLLTDNRNRPGQGAAPDDQQATDHRNDIAEAAETAKVTIASSLLEVETELISGGLESGEAAAFVRAMPTADELLTPVDVGELEPGGGARRHWEPAPAVVSEILTPSTAATREAKRRAVVAALVADPAASDRQIARAAGVDHKTVGKLRGEGGENPHPGGDFPTDSPVDSPAADAPGGPK